MSRDTSLDIEAEIAVNNGSMNFMLPLSISCGLLRVVLFHKEILIVGEKTDIQTGRPSHNRRVIPNN